MSTNFSHRVLPRVNKPVHRLGLACNFGLDARGLSTALERGLNYVYWTRRRTAHLRPTLQVALAKDRERYVIAAATTLGFFGFNLRAACERALQDLRTDYLDVLIVSWLGVTAAYSEGVVKAMAQLKAEGKVRAFGTSIHDRVRAGRLAEDSAIDLFMLRYNAAHPGAEQDVFPHLERRQPAVAAYTATSWRKLLRRPAGWDAAPMSAGDCYRFCLSNPHVDVVLTGPASEAQLVENLSALEAGPLSAEEEAWMRRFGRAVHG
jgi:aryl-alcohol dehydrogenase-like predicted oxidoreductase